MSRVKLAMRTPLAPGARRTDRSSRIPEQVAEVATGNLERRAVERSVGAAIGGRQVGRHFLQPFEIGRPGRDAGRNRIGGNSNSRRREQRNSDRGKRIAHDGTPYLVPERQLAADAPAMIVSRVATSQSRRQAAFTRRQAASARAGADPTRLLDPGFWPTIEWNWSGASTPIDPLPQLCSGILSHAPLNPAHRRPGSRSVACLSAVCARSTDSLGRPGWLASPGDLLPSPGDLLPSPGDRPLAPKGPLRPNLAGWIWRDVLPALAGRCFACHGPDGRKRSAARPRDARAGGADGIAIVPGQSGKSPLVVGISGTDADLRMPPKGEPARPRDRGSDSRSGSTRVPCGRRMTPLPPVAAKNTGRCDRWVPRRAGRVRSVRPMLIRSTAFVPRRSRLHQPRLLHPRPTGGHSCGG